MNQSRIGRSNIRFAYYRARVANVRLMIVEKAGSGRYGSAKSERICG